MGYKKKRENKTDEYLEKIKELIKALSLQNGFVDVTKDDKKADLAYVLALLLNQYFASCEDKEIRNFGADRVRLVKLQAKEKNFLCYWGIINWLSTPKEHKCYRSFRDPFYALFQLENEQLQLIEA